jgi:hypothetical protein
MVTDVEEEGRKSRGIRSSGTMCESSGSDALAKGRRRRSKTTRLLLRPEAATETHQATTAKYSAHKTTKKKENPQLPKNQNRVPTRSLRNNFRGGFFCFSCAEISPLGDQKKETRRVSGITTCVNEWLLPPLTRHILTKKKSLYRHIWTKVLVSDLKINTFGDKNSPFCYLSKKKSQAIWSRELLGEKFPEKSPFFEETCYEIAKILGGFGQFF